MSTRVALIFASFVSLSVSFAQEESPPASAPAAAGSPAAASPASTTPPLSASVAPSPSTGAPQGTDVLFKNLKARSIGPAVMGGRVSDIAIDPRNPFVFYVALGHGGVFKSGDSGVSFDPIFDKQSVLSIGAIAISPSDSDVIWVGSCEANDRNSSDWWDGVYRTTDGGLRPQPGRIGLAVSASNPKVVMAVGQSFEGGSGTLSDLRSKSGGVFRSEDNGEHWTRMSAIAPRPFYFSQIRIDPANDQRVYLLQFALLVSDDGGKNFREDLSEKVHPDCHALAVQPGTVPQPKPPKPEDKNKPPKPPVCQRLLLGTDGGMYQSFAGGKNWDHLNKIPSGE